MSDFDTMTDEEIADYDEWEAQYEAPPRAFCDNYEPHEAHCYLAINTNYYNCPGLSAEELAKIEEYEASVGTCEHGLSADLCAGEGHYPGRHNGHPEYD